MAKDKAKDKACKEERKTNYWAAINSTNHTTIKTQKSKTIEKPEKEKRHMYGLLQQAYSWEVSKLLISWSRIDLSHAGMSRKGKEKQATMETENQKTKREGAGKKQAMKNMLYKTEHTI